MMTGKHYVYGVAANLDLSSVNNGLDADGTKLYCTTMAKEVADKAMQVQSLKKKCSRGIRERASRYSILLLQNIFVFSTWNSMEMLQLYSRSRKLSPRCVWVSAAGTRSAQDKASGSNQTHALTADVGRVLFGYHRPRQSTSAASSHHPASSSHTHCRECCVHGTVPSLTASLFIFQLSTNAVGSRRLWIL